GKPRDDAGRAGAKVLRVDPPRNRPHRDVEGGLQGDGKPHPGKGREDQGPAAVQQAEFDIMYGTGFSWEGTVMDVGIERKVVTKSGSYFSFGDERLGQGRQNATAFLKEHPDVTQQILQGIQVQIGPDQVVSARLLPLVEEAESNGAPSSKTAKVAAAVAAVADVGAASEE